MSTIAFVNRSRRKKLEALLQDDFVMVHLAIKSPSLVIPDHLRQESSVTLKLSFWFKGRVELKEDHIEAELSFSGTSFLCAIPYTAIWAVTTFNNEFELWDTEMKEQLTSVVSPNKTNPLPKANPTEEESAVKPSLSLASETPPSDEPKKVGKRPRPLLRRVK